MAQHLLIPGRDPRVVVKQAIQTIVLDPAVGQVMTLSRTLVENAWSRRYLEVGYDPTVVVEALRRQGILTSQIDP